MEFVKVKLTEFSKWPLRGLHSPNQGHVNKGPLL